ncbi:hypothetical protein QBC40DRAFT_350372 [Triangularia verruculosa]|uniref:Uncharacterized protein n=1 Tax=Triangularia verruculosa TaxID=2587418 RepID=A0AAN6XCS4_9PEZI|nr:hypothetical protein QBC40DRAFT_350372 [Triangularia verruculosa]
MPHKIRNTLSGLLALAITTAAQEPEFGDTGHVFTFNSDATFNITMAQVSNWVGSFDQGYNATATAPIKAYNMSQEFPLSDLPETKPWEYSIKVKELSDSKTARTWLQVKTPESNLVPSPSNPSILEIPQHHTWSTCALFFVSNHWTRDTPLPGRGCTGFFSQDCIDEFQQNLEAHYRNSTDNTFTKEVHNKCPLPLPDIIPRRCQSGDVTGVGGTLEQVWYGDFPNAVRYQVNGTYDFQRLVHVGNRTADALTQAVNQVYVIGHIWGYNGTYPGEKTGFTQVPVTRAEVTCLKAEVVEGGAVDKPDSEDDDNDGGEGDGGGKGNEGGNGNGNKEEDPSQNSAALSRGLSTEVFCKLALAAAAASFLSL